MRIALPCLLALLFLAAPAAFGHSWYERQWCSGQDCEPLPIDGIEEVQGGWRVHYVSPRFGPIEAFVPRGLARDSQDGRFHGCWRLGDRKPICLYVPRNV